MKRLTSFGLILTTGALFAAGPVAELYPTHLTLLNDFDDGTLTPTIGDVTSPTSASQYLIGDGGLLGTKALVGGGYYFPNSGENPIFSASKPGTAVFLVKLVSAFDPTPAKEPGATHFCAQWSAAKRLLGFRQADLNWGSAPLSAYYHCNLDGGGQYVVRADDYAGSLKTWTPGDWHLVAVSHTPDAIGISVDGRPFKEAMLTEKMATNPYRIDFNALWGAGSTAGIFAMDDCGILNFKLSDGQVAELYAEYRAMLAATPPTAETPRVTLFATEAASETSYRISATVSNPSASSVTVRFTAVATPENSQPASTDRSETLAPGESRTFTLTGPVLGEEKVTADVSVTSSDGETVWFNRHRVFAPNAPEPEWMRDPTAMSFKFAYYPSTNTVHAAVDVTGCGGAANATAVRLSILDGTNKAVLATRTFAPDPSGKTEIFWRDLADLGDGEYICRAVVEGVENATLDQAFVRRHFVWEGNQFGLSETVPVPFEKVKREEAGGDGGSTAELEKISVVLREHIVDKETGLWQQVTAAGKEVLARPMRLVAGRPEVAPYHAGTATVGTGTVGAATVGAATVGAATVGGDLRAPRRLEVSSSSTFNPQPSTFNLSTSSTWDVDGLMEWKLTLAPGHYEPFSLEIPIRAERATLYHACTDGIRINSGGALTNGVGRIWDSTKAARRSIVGNYVPYLWVGGPLRGVAVFGENDRGWETDGETPCQEIVREADGTVVIRLNLVQTEIDVTEARTIRLGFMATPVKPMPDNWRSLGHGTLLGACYYWGGYTASESVEPFDGTDEFFRKMAEARQTGSVDEAYLKQAVESYPYTETPGTAAWTNKHNTIRAHFQSGLTNSKWAGTTGNLVFYTNGRGVHYGDASQQGATYCNEWNRYEYMNRAFTLSSSAAYDLDPVATYRDYAAWWYDRMLSKGAANHLYWDDVFCQSSFNLVQTDAYRLPNGRIQPSSGIFNMRALVKRCAVLQAEKGLDTRGNWVHMTDTALAPVLSFAGVNYDWEDIADTRTFQERYPRGRILACTIGRQFGNRVGIMGYFDKSDPDVYAHLVHTGVGVMLTHELRWNASGHEEYVTTHRFLTDWGYRTDAVRVWNDWDEDETYPLDVDGVENASIAMGKASAGEAMICVSSFSATNGVVRIRPDVSALGFGAGSWRATHALTGEGVPVRNGTLELPLEAYDWALVRLTGASTNATYVPVEFIQSDGYAYLDTGIPGNAKKIQQKARLQYLAVPGSTSYQGVFGSYGDPANVVCYESCAFVVASNKQEPAYAASDSSGYYWGAPTKNGWVDYYLHHGYAQNYGGAIAQSGVTKVGYNWNSLKNEDFSTLLVGNVNKPDSTPYTEQTVPTRWYSYEAIDHDSGASLIRLTPVKCVATGEFGMLDAVNGGFYTSAVANHPFLGPKTVAWTGSATAYDPNVLIRVPAGTTNVVGNADVATINNLGGILVEDPTSVFSFSNFTASVTLYAPFYGPGEVRAEYSEASKSLKLSSDNRAFSGTLTLHRAQVDLYNRYGLGLTNRVYYGTDGAASRLLDLHTGGETAVKMRFGGTGDSSRLVQSQSDTFTFAGPIELALKSSLSLNAGNGTLRFTGPLTNVLTTGSIINPSKPVVFEGDHDRHFGKCYMRSGGQLSLGGRMHFASRGYGTGNNPQDYGNVGASGGNSVAFMNDNVLDEDVVFLMGWSYTASPTPSGSVDLNGFDQRVGRLITGVGGTVSSATRPQATSLTLKSGAPATLRIRNTAVYGHGHFVTDLPGCWPGRVNGAASVEIDTSASIANPGIVSFTCAGSTTTGGLYARRGTIKVYETATFSNLTALVATGAGSLEILTSEIGGGSLGVVLTNSTLASGKVPLTLGATCTLKADTAFVTKDGRNVWLEKGDYTSADLPELLGGDGTLRVSRYGGKRGLVLWLK